MSWESEEPRAGYLDQMHFKAYCLAVLAFIESETRQGRSVTQGDILKATGRDKQKMLADALEWLADKIIDVGGYICRYQAKDMRPVPKYSRSSIAPGKASDRTTPYATALYGDKARGF